MAVGAAAFKSLAPMVAIATATIVNICLLHEKGLHEFSDILPSRRLSPLLDPKTVTPKEHDTSEPFFFVREGDALGLFNPAEVIIEIVSSAQNDYSVTIVSEGKYTGTATFVDIDVSTGNKIYSWIPSFPDDSYQILVHEIDRKKKRGSPLIHPSPLQISINLVNIQEANDNFNAVLKARLNMPPCQSIDGRFDGYSRWTGDWIGPEMKIDVDKIRTGWGFLPSRDMGCKIETFSKEDLLASPDKKSIFVVGTSRERGIFLSLVDMLLEPREKEHLGDSVVGQCWGRAIVEKGNMKVSYQDFRVNSFERPYELGSTQCHNDKVVRGGQQSLGSFLGNATAFWNELFEDDTTWPDVIYLLSGHRASGFDFESHTLSFVRSIPPFWTGTLIISDYEFSAEDAGLEREPYIEAYRTDLLRLLDIIDDPRVRWLDGEGISKEHRMYGERGEDQVSLSQHFHHNCEIKKVYLPQGVSTGSDVMRVCSNITEIVAQLLIGHALGPKDVFHESMKQISTERKNEMTPKICHNCPKGLLPFHITPHPQLACGRGALHPRTKDEMDPAVASKEAPLQKCPCMSQSVDYSFHSQSDVVEVRDCKK